jgi:hypothetical protein
LEDNIREKRGGAKTYIEPGRQQIRIEESWMEAKPYVEKMTLREKRKAFGLTQGELGKMLDLAQMHVSIVELGQLTFLPHQRAAIEAILGPIDWDERYAKLRRAEGFS